MKRAIIVFAAIIMFLPVQLLSQQANNMVKKKNGKGKAAQEQEYNQSKLHRIKVQHIQRIQQIALINGQRRQNLTAGINPGGFGNKGIFNTSLTRYGFGFSSFLNHRMKNDLFVVGEVGYFYTTTNRSYKSSLDRYIDDRTSARIFGVYPGGNLSEATLIPLYGGIRKGFQLSSRFKRFYPYIGAGAGPVFGMGFMRHDLVVERSFQFAPSAYALIGSEIYTNSRLFIDLSVRYRYLNFSRQLANWKNFSGFSVNLGFGYGLGKQLLR